VTLDLTVTLDSGGQVTLSGTGLTLEAVHEILAIFQSSAMLALQERIERSETPT
jgi:hypothetical protein